MRCKPGDLAIVVKSRAGNEGKIVTCLRFVGEVPGFEGNDYWRTDTVVLSRQGLPNSYFRDSYLCPLRGSDRQDQTLTWKPIHEPA